MRTKTLLLTAALGAAGIITSLAQDPVYSVNAVGYINMDLGAGFELVANQLNNGDNTLNEVLTGLSAGTTCYKWNGTGYDDSTYAGEGVGWLNNYTLAPGEGVFVQSLADQTLTLVGEVPQGSLSVPYVAGLNVVSSPVPQADTLNALGLGGTTGDSIFLWDASVQGYSAVSPVFIEGVGWSPDSEVAVGQAFWVQALADNSWDRDFSVNE